MASYCRHRIRHYASVLRRIREAKTKIDHLQREVELLQSKKQEMLDRDVEIYYQVVELGRRPKTVGREYDLHYSTISRILNTIEDMLDLTTVQRKLEEIRDADNAGAGKLDIQAANPQPRRRDKAVPRAAKAPRPRKRAVSHQR